MANNDDLKWLKGMLRNANRRKATPGNGFLKMRLKEAIAKLENEEKK